MDIIKKKFLNFYNLNFIKIFLFTFFIGQAFYHFFFNPPYEAFFYNYQFFGWFIDWIPPLNWQQFIQSSYWYNFLQNTIKLISGYFLFLSLFMLISNKKQIISMKYLLWIASLILFFMACCSWIENHFKIAQLLEFALQFSTPLLLYLIINNNTKNFIITAKIATALTFIGHGLYAAGIHPVPGNFLEMVIETLGLSLDQAYIFLKVEGILDFLFAIGLFMPFYNKYIILYGVIWGFLTSLARLTTYIHFEHLFLLSFYQSFYKFLIRTPHFIIPLMISSFYFNSNKKL